MMLQSPNRHWYIRQRVLEGFGSIQKRVRCKCHCLWQLAISCYSTAEVSILLYRRALRLWKNFAQSDKPQSEASTFKAKSLTTDCKREQICVQCSTDLVREMRSSKPVISRYYACVRQTNQHNFWPNLRTVSTNYSRNMLHGAYKSMRFSRSSSTWCNTRMNVPTKLLGS